jgi:hypothetical protein
MNKRVLYNSLIYLFFTLLVLATSTFPFFWDTIQLASKHAHYFYESNFSSIILPNEIDSGHIPTLGIYIALIWKIFGKSLVLRHLAMLPFVWGIVYQSIQLTKRLFVGKWTIAAILLFLADATLMAQCTLVSPDVLLVFFFVMALNHFYSYKKVWFAIALAGLGLASMRGMMCFAALFIAHLIIKSLEKPMKGNFGAKLKSVFSSAFSILPLYLPAFVIVFSFLAWHYYKTGWIGYHKNMPWYPLFEIVDFKGAIRNVFILGWRLIDFGRLFVWLTGIICVWHYFKKRPALNDTFRNLVIIYICLLLALGRQLSLIKDWWDIVIYCHCTFCLA